MSLFGNKHKKKGIYKIVPILGLLIFLINFTIKIIDLMIKLNTQNIACFCLNLIGIIAFTLLIFKPMKFEIYGIFSLIYSILMLVTVSNIILSFSICLLSIACLYSRGYLNRGKRPKIISIGTIIFVLFSTRVRFGLYNFIGDTLVLLAFILVLAVAYLVLYPNTIKPAMDALHSTVIDFSDYTGLSDYEKGLIKDALQGKRYREMADERNYSESVIKKKMQKIFKILDVPDLNGFMAKFGNRKVVGL